MIVVSAISIREAGPLTVLESTIDDLTSKLNNVYVLVGDTNVLSENKFVNKIVIKWPRKSWLHRLFFEYVWCYFWSKKRKISVWISLHDITPLVVAKKQIVYCHNPMPFTKTNFKYILEDPKQFIFFIFYIFVYKFFVNRNDILIVQQEWLANKFKSFFKNKIVVISPYDFSRNSPLNRKLKLIYPSFPRATKNHIYLIKLAEALKDIMQIEILFTMNGEENILSKKLLHITKNLPNIKFIGWKTFDDLKKVVESCDAIVFPSLAETWGLPLVEFQSLNKFTFVSDLPYAYETCAGMDNVFYFNPYNVNSLTGIIRATYNVKSNKYLFLNKISELIIE